MEEKKEWFCENCNWTGNTNELDYPTIDHQGRCPVCKNIECLTEEIPNRPPVK